MRNFKLTGKKIINYVKNNIYVLLIGLYGVLAALVSPDLIFRYGETKFFLFFIGGGLILIAVLKIFSIKKSKNKSWEQKKKWEKEVS